MGVIHHQKMLLRCRDAINALAFALFAFGALNLTCNAQPVLSLPVFSSNGRQAQITVSNCYTTHAQYLLQVSTNLTDWSTTGTNSSSGTNFSVTVLCSNSVCFYRLGIYFPPTLAILCKTAFDEKGNNCTFDSFDSSNPAFSTGGQYEPTKREANANIGALFGNSGYSLNLANANAYGSVYTAGAGSVNLGLHGSVGDLAWVGSGTSGIEAGHWATNLNLTVPDVATPNTSGWFTALPSATNGVVMLTNSGAGYYLAALPSSPLVITAPTRIWVTGSASLGVTISNRVWVAGGVTNATVGQLSLFVGQASGSATSLSWSGQGTLNVPGYASNFQIYGLPSLTTINLSGNAGWNATIYAPEATLEAGGGGANTQDTSGAIVVDNIVVSGHWNFHFDEHLATLNPFP